MSDKIKIFMLLFVFVPKISAQTKSSEIVIDADTKEPPEFANAVLLKSDSAFVDGASCDSIGLFPLGITLEEVSVTGSRMIQKADRKLFIPNPSQVKASNSGVTLLRNLQLPRIVINPIDNMISTPDGSPVQLRINGVEVTAAEVVALQPQDIILIEYYEDPGMRYGNAAAVIDYIIRRRDSGGNISTNLMNAFWRLGFAEDYFSAKVNRKKSEFGVNAYYHYRDLEWTRENRQTFVFPTAEIRRDEIGKPTNVNEKMLNFAANYNLNEPDKYLFNVTFRNGYYRTPNSFSDRISTLYSSNDPVPASVSDRSTWKNNTPSLDVYYQRNLKHDQLLIFDAVGTYMDSKSTRLYRQEQEGKDPYISYSCITGNKYSLITEGIYEKKFKTGTLTAGLRHAQSYTENVYAGNVTSSVGLTVAETNVYAEYRLSRDKFNYTFGLGTMRTFNSQDETDMEKYILRPSLRIVYNINDHTYVKYNGYISGYPPSLSDLNNVSQNIDAYRIQQGNPNLQTVWYVLNYFNAGYNKGIFGAEFFTEYAYRPKSIMEQITLADSMFVHTNINQRAYHHLYSGLTLKLKPWKEYITLSVTPTFDRYVNKGTDYLHEYNKWGLRASLLASYKNWTFYAEGYTRRNYFWGETLYLNEQMIILQAGYNTQKWSASVVMLNPFSNEYSLGNKNYSALAPYTSNVYSNNLGRVIGFNFSLNLNFGRKYNAANKRLDNKDTDSGIMTGTKN